MATIEIPDRICPHCGGIKWKTEYRKKPTKANPDKKVIRYRCVKKGNERSAKWQLNNPDKVKEHSNRYKKERRANGYYKTPKERERSRLKAEIESGSLHDNFIKKKIMRSVSGISRSDIPQKLIDITRKHLLLIRQAKQLEDEKTKQERKKG